MNIHVLGAAGGVTGSAYHVRTRSASVLIDFGLFQGHRALERHNRVPARLPVKQLGAVVLTHGHLDHTGRLPLLAKAGYRGPVYATPASIAVTRLILEDTARLQASDAERESRHHLAFPSEGNAPSGGRRAGRPPVEPLFTPGDVRRLEPLFRPIEYGEPREVAPGVRVRLTDAGHILGSASVELTAKEGNSERVVVFSGDLGPRGAALHRDPVPFGRADLVFLESTYGDRDHRPPAETVKELERIVVAATRVGADGQGSGKILIPVFAVGRAQQILYHLAGMFQHNVVPRFPVYLDSPMAVAATEIYLRNSDLLDAEALALVKSGLLAEGLKTLRAVTTAEESRALNDAPGPCAILAGSGMCTGGRILHHLRHNLWKPETAVLFVGYQAEGTLGRRLVDGAKTVRIFGEPVAVRASVYTLGGFSGHAGQSELLEWLAAVAPRAARGRARPRVVLTHGEERGRRPLGELIRKRFGLPVEHPRLGDTITLG